MTNPALSRPISACAQALDPERLRRRAETETGLSDWGEPAFEEPLDRLCRAGVEEAALEGPGLDRFVGILHGALTNRLKLYADRARYPEIAAQEIKAPLVVTGLPRSGTTILHALLAQDPAVRSPRKWEIDTPSPPPRAETYQTDPRIAACQAGVERLPAQFRAMHAMGATLPEECNGIMTLAFLSPNFGASANIPSYVNWLIEAADMGPAFALHRHMLQHMQAFAPGRFWVLKSPPFLWWPKELLTAYPDARVVITHRDPAQVMASNASLIAYLRGMTGPVDPLRVGAEQLDQWKIAVARTLAYRADTTRPDRFLDSQYRDFIREPLTVARAIYDHFDIPLSDEATARMTAFLEENQQDKHGKHVYAPADFGLTAERMHREFAAYIDTHAIPLG